MRRQAGFAVKEKGMHPRISIFAVHPEDELGMAGAIAAHARAGADVTVVPVTNGSEGCLGPDRRDTIVRTRGDEADRCDRILGRGHALAKAWALPAEKGDAARKERLEAARYHELPDFI